MPESFTEPMQFGRIAGTHSDCIAPGTVVHCDKDIREDDDVDTKREEKIRAVFGWKKLGLGTKMLFISLKTDEELTLCALSCRANEKKPFALKAIEKITDTEALYRIAAEAPTSESRVAAIDRFKDDRSMLMRVWRITWSKEKWLLNASRKRAAEHLAVLERQQIAEAGGDAKRLADLLCGGKLVVCRADALEQIEDEKQLLRVVLNAPAGENADAALNRLAGLAKKARNVDPLLCVMQSATALSLQKDAENKIAALCIGDDAIPLDDAQREQLFTYYTRVKDLMFIKGLDLLHPEQLLELYRLRKAKSDQITVAEHLHPEDCPDEIRVRLFLARGEQAAPMFTSLDTAHLVRLYEQQSEEKLLFYLYSLLSERGACTETINTKMDAIVQPQIEATRTSDGYDGKALCQLDMKLNDALRERYGFVEEFRGGETIDGASWSTKQLRFDGRLYWFYYQQSDGGGSFHALGEKA